MSGRLELGCSFLEALRRVRDDQSLGARPACASEDEASTIYFVPSDDEWRTVDGVYWPPIPPPELLFALWIVVSLPEKN